MTQHPCVLSYEEISNITNTVFKEDDNDLSIIFDDYDGMGEWADAIVQANAEKLAKQREPLSKEEILLRVEPFYVGKRTIKQYEEYYGLTDKDVIDFARSIEARCGGTVDD